MLPLLLCAVQHNRSYPTYVIHTCLAPRPSPQTCIVSKISSRDPQPLTLRVGASLPGPRASLSPRCRTRSIDPICSPFDPPPGLRHDTMAAPSTKAEKEKAAYTEKMAYYLNKVNPIPALPEYTGPYKVGTVDVEISVADLKAPSSAPPSAADIHTVLFRIYYPARPESRGKRITWLPAPQRSHVSAYTKFLGFGPLSSEIISYVGLHLRPSMSLLMLRPVTDFFLDTSTIPQYLSTKTPHSSSPTTYRTSDGPPWSSPTGSAAPETHTPT